MNTNGNRPNKDRYCYLLATNVLKGWKRSGEEKDGVTYAYRFLLFFNLLRRSQKHPYISGVVELGQLVMDRFRFLPHHLDLIYHMSYNGYKWRRESNKVHSYTKSVIQKRRDALKNPNVENETKRKYVDFLDILLGARVSKRATLVIFLPLLK